MRRVVLVVNPFATRVSEARLAAVEAVLAGAAELSVVQTRRPLHAVELVQEACADGCEAVVVFSGDGGFNEALNGLAGDLPIGFLPGGGTSVLPRALGLPLDPIAAARRVADALATGRTRRISLGVVNGRRFAFAAGVGLDAEAIRRVDALGRRDDGKRPGDVAFTLAVLRAVAARRGRLSPALEVKGRGRASFALVANCAPYTYAHRVALPIARAADFELGLDLVAPVQAGVVSLPLVAAAVLSGRAGGSRFLTGHDLDRIEIACDGPLPLHADGEDLGDVEEVVFEAQRDAVSVLV